MKKLLVMMVLVAVAGSASAGLAYFTGADTGNNLFSDADNWTRDTTVGVLPVAGDVLKPIIATATSLSNPGQLDAAFNVAFDGYFGNSYLMPNANGTAYIEVLSGAAWRSGSLTIGNGNVGLTARHAVMTLKSGSSLNSYANGGNLTIGTGAGGSTGRLAAEDGLVAFTYANLLLKTTGTMAFQFGSDSVSTFVSSKSNGAATMLLDGTVELDLGALNTVGTYTLFTGSHVDTVLSGALITDLTTAGGSIVSSGTSTRFNALNEGDIVWNLTKSGEDLVLNVTAVPEPATIGMLGLGALITLLFRRMRI